MLKKSIELLLEEAERRENILKTTDYRSKKACREHWLQYHKERGQSEEDHRKMFRGFERDHREFAAALREVCAVATGETPHVS